MFDIGFQELLLVGVIALLIMGPERLPSAVRTASLWLSRLRRSFQQIKTEIEREIGADDIKQQLHNESILSNLEQVTQDLQNNIKTTTDSLKPSLDKLQYDVSDILEPKNLDSETVEPKTDNGKN